MSRSLRGLRLAGPAIAGEWRRTIGDPRRLAIRLWVLLGIVLVWGLWYAPSTTGDTLGIRRFRTPEITGTTRIAQQFVMRERMLTGVEVRPSIVGEVEGMLRFTFSDLTDERVIQSVDVSARDVVSGGWFGLSLDRIDDSRGHWYELAIASSEAMPARGVAFWATKGARLDNAMLLINSAERWADLTFRTRTATRSMIEALRSADDSGRRRLAVAALVAVWLLVGVLLRATAVMARTSSGTETSS